MSLFSDPVKWAEQVAKTKLRLVVTSFITLGILVFLFWLHHLILSSHRGLELDFFRFVMGQQMVIYFAVILPGFYLYAIYRLLRIINENEQ
jgi:hypothetical protein